ncbi:MAG: class D beta-lactamase [Pseudomonadota bacterium]
MAMIQMLLAVALLLPVAKPAASLEEDAFTQAVARVLAKHETSGSFTVYDEQQQLFLRSDPAKSRTPEIPASTFKIPNSLIALQTGVITAPDEVIPWDGVERQIKSWNQDQTLASAVRYSTVWVFQGVARAVGRPAMQRFLDQLGYGNGQIGEVIDRFWLDGSLKITPQQQIEFLRRLYHHQLPFEKRHMTAVQDMIVRKQEDGYRLSGKTGWAIQSDPDRGWFVGYLERQRQVWFFALLVDIHTEGRGPDRQGITEEILRELELIQP